MRCITAWCARNGCGGLGPDGGHLLHLQAGDGGGAPQPQPGPGSSGGARTLPLYRNLLQFPQPVTLMVGLWLVLMQGLNRLQRCSPAPQSHPVLLNGAAWALPRHPAPRQVYCGGETRGKQWSPDFSQIYVQTFNRLKMSRGKVVWPRFTRSPVVDRQVISSMAARTR